MKKYLLSILAMSAFTAFTFASTSCSDDENPGEPVVPSTEGKILITYFSFPETDGVDASSGASRVVVDGTMLGSTQYMANVISEATGGDLFRIETVQQYPGLHQPLIEQASAEKDAGARPELSTKIENLADYDIVFIGYPNWWGDLPMPMYTFLEEYDFGSKTIVPFNSHGGSGFSSTINAIMERQRNATVVNGLSESRNTVGSSRGRILSWLEEIGFEL